MPLVLALLAVTLAAPFGEASARSGPDGLEVRLEVAGEPAVVVAHVLDPGGGAAVTALARLEPGRWGGLVPVGERRPVLRFEALWGADSELSDAVTLTALGVPEATGAPSPTASNGPGIRLLAGLAVLAAASGAVLVWSGRRWARERRP